MMKTRIALAVVALIPIGLALSPIPWSLEAHADPDDPAPEAHVGEEDLEQPPPTIQPLTYDPSVSLAPLVERLGPAVVNVDISKHVELGPLGSWMLDSDGSQSLPVGQGSGFLISEDGYILTNNHVISGADQVDIRLSDERIFQAKVVGSDPRTDVALVKIESDELFPWVALGESEAARVGDWVVAIGNPFGLEHTVTAGIVSAKGRVLGAGPYDDFIQTDASINPGNSGGPLFNLSGEVVGINTAVSSRGSGIGFAVPVDIVKEILDELKTEGVVRRGWMGVGLVDIDSAIAEKLELDVEEGVLLSAVYPSTPAYEAGLEVGDVLLKMDDEDISSSDSLVRAVGKRRPGEEITLSIRRGKRSKKISVTLASRPDEQVLRRSGATGTQPAPTPEPPRLGIGIRELEPRDHNDLTGVGISRIEPGGRADGRLRTGDLILQIDGRDMRTVRDVQGAIRDGKEVLIFLVERDGQKTRVEIPLS
jgi:serine protease Do